MTIGKLLSRHNLRSLGLALARNILTENDAQESIYRMRYRFITGLNSPIYAECNPQLEGVLHIIPKVFPNLLKTF